MAIQIQEAAAGPSSPLREGQANYTLSHSLSGHSRSVTALQFTPDGNILISAGADGMLQFWESHTGQHIRSIKAHRSGINDLSISPDGLYVATAADDKYIHIHSTLPPASHLPSASTHKSTSSTRLKRLQSHTAAVLCLAFSPTSECLVSGSFDESAIIWDIRSGNPLRTLPAHSEAVWTVNWDREAGMVITGSADGLIRLWDAHTGQCLKTVDNDMNSPVAYAAFTPSSTFILSSTLSSTLRIYNIYTSKVLKTLKAPSEFVSSQFPCPVILFPAPLSTSQLPLSNATWMGNGAEAWVVSGSENGSLVLWEVSSRRVVQVLKDGGHKKPVVALAVSPDGKMIASGSLEPEKVVHVWLNADLSD